MGLKNMPQENPKKSITQKAWGTLTVCLEISHFSISNAEQEILQRERDIRVQ